MKMFRDRSEAGRRLAEALIPMRSESPVVLGLPRGGVPVANEVAKALGAPLDVIVVRKLGIPYQPEVAMGAVGEQDVRLVDWEVVSLAGVTAAEVREAVERETDEVRRRARLFRGGRPPLDIEGRTVIVVDDGIATGSTIGAAVRVARVLGAARVVVAAPVAPPEVPMRLRQTVDEVVVLETPHQFRSVGEAYVDFDQVPDGMVAAVLRRYAAGAPSAPVSPTLPAVV
jgi:putative phosphoribosyl transferase